MDSGSARGIDRRRLVGWGGVTAALLAAGAPLMGTRLAHAAPAATGSDAAEPSGADQLPPDTLPGGAYDRYLAELAEQDKFSGVVLLSYRGRTVLSRSYGMADRERGIPNHEGVAVNLGSGIKPFVAVAILQLAQRGELRLFDSVGTFLTGYASDIAEQVTIHHLLTNTAGLTHPERDLQRVFYSREEVHEFYEQWSRQARLVAAPGTGFDNSGADYVIAAQIVEAVTGMTYWDYVHEHIFGRSGMTGSAFYTRPQWLTDEHIAHSYMLQEDGSRVDAVRNLDKGTPGPYEPGKNTGRNFIDYADDGGFATAPDLVRFAHALRTGRVLDRPYVDLLFGAKIPASQSKGGGPAPAHPSFMAYAMPAKLFNGQWIVGRGGANPGSVANWHIYPDTGWVGVVLSNYDGVPMQEILDREMRAITGQR